MMKKKILFFDPSPKLTSVYDLKTRGRGGMVSSLFKVSDYLSLCGHDVSILTSIEKPGMTLSGVKWHNAETFPRAEQWDVLVLNRGVQNGLPDITARRRILWTHDLPHNGFCLEPATMRAIDMVVFMSEYAERVWRCFFHTIGKSTTIPNGVDKGMFYPRDKDLGYLIYCSAPNRGLKRLPLIFESIQSRVTRPVWMRAYSNMKSLHPNEVRDDEEDGFSLAYKDCHAAGIELLDPVRQDVLAEELGRAGLMILPTDYPEICSNVVLQSLASGTPIVTTGGLGSAGEWVRDGKNGRLTLFQPVDYMVHTLEIVRAAVEVLENEQLHRRMIKVAAQTQIETWEAIGAKWDRMIRRL
jgi:glycosyltransferase involved in cell wall biosynthesis